MKTQDIKKQIKKLEEQKEKAEEKIQSLNLELENESNKSDWIKIPELKIEIQTKIHHKGKSYNQLKEEFGEEYLEKYLPTYNQLQTLRNLEHKGKYKLGLIRSWEFVKQEDEISKENGYIARFYANSDYADLVCYENSSGSYSYLGVRFVRRTKVEK